MPSGRFLRARNKEGQVAVTSFDYRKVVWPVENMRDNVSAGAGLMDDSRQIYRCATGSWRLQLHTVQRHSLSGIEEAGQGRTRGEWLCLLHQNLVTILQPSA
jgi:hypothetical protein